MAILRGLLFFFVFGLSSLSYNKSALLCGGDEDGCDHRSLQYCLCFPFNEKYGNQRYCLDFDRMLCHPLSLVSNCPETMIMADQASCLATIYQSQRFPPCEKTTMDFCKENHILQCDENGQLGSCH